MISLSDDFLQSGIPELKSALPVKDLAGEPVDEGNAFGQFAVADLA